MPQMIYFELKKIFTRSTGKIAILLLCFLLGITCFLAIQGVNYVNEQGDTETGYAAIQKLRSAKKEWSGCVDEELLRRVIEENARINATPEGQSTDVTLSNIAYGEKQGFSDLRSLLVHSFGAFRVYDYYLTDSLTPDDASRFYTNYTTQLREWLDTEAKDTYSDAQKAWMIQKYEELPTPLWYDYADGWLQLQEYLSTIVMITVLILSFLIAGIFSSEFSWKADAIFFSTRCGRKQATAAKVWAGFLTITVIYWGMILLYTGILLGFLGTDGADCLIQTFRWKSLYHLTNGQAYLLSVLGGYAGCLFLLLCTMLASAKTRSSVFAVTIPFLLIFAPSFLTSSRNPLLTKLIALMPDQLLQMNTVFSLFSLFDIGGHTYRSGELLAVIYPAVIVLLIPLIYRVYRKTQIA